MVQEDPNCSSLYMNTTPNYNSLYPISPQIFSIYYQPSIMYFPFAYYEGFCNANL